MRSEGRRRGRTRGREALAAYAFLLPWFGGVVVLTAGPLIASLYLSFTNFDLLQAPDWVGLGNYANLLNDSRFLTSLGVTFTYVFLGVPLQLAFALAVAMLLNQKVRGLAIFRSVYYLPSLLGGSVAVAVMWRQLFGGTGVINQVLGAFGISAPNWIADPRFALYTLVILHVWQFGSAMVIFLAGLQQVPADLYDAAAVDGASKWQQLLRITIPMITPVIFFNLVLGVINSFQAFTSAYIVSGGTGGPLDSTLFYTLYLYQQGFTNFQMGYASAMAWVLLVIIAIFTALNFATSRRWVYYGNA
ncbi:carbohydrate ABC transporter permease [Pseudactinotalea sp.]|uniref:carbohydrate ABC transporter permease n=1 Tax=Pseudactinotalea sp. TaxID=1926260 RepID=UPI003B3A62AF